MNAGAAPVCLFCDADVVDRFKFNDRNFFKAFAKQFDHIGMNFRYGRNVLHEAVISAALCAVLTETEGKGVIVLNVFAVLCQRYNPVARVIGYIDRIFNAVHHIVVIRPFFRRQITRIDDDPSAVDGPVFRGVLKIGAQLRSGNLFYGKRICVLVGGKQIPH